MYYALRSLYQSPCTCAIPNPANSSVQAMGCRLGVPSSGMGWVECDNPMAGSRNHSCNKWMSPLRLTADGWFGAHLPQKTQMEPLQQRAPNAGCCRHDTCTQSNGEVTRKRGNLGSTCFRTLISNDHVLSELSKSWEKAKCLLIKIFHFSSYSTRTQDTQREPFLKKETSFFKRNSQIWDKEHSPVTRTWNINRWWRVP